MRVIVDAFGGDNAPLEVIKGCARAVSELGVNVVLTGSRNKIEKCAAENGISLSGIEIEHTDDVFDIHEEPKERWRCPGRFRRESAGFSGWHILKWRPPRSFPP